MEQKRFELVFDKVIIKQLKQAAKSSAVQEILSKMLDRIELEGPNAGNLIDSQLYLYEVKNKHPPIRLYFRYKIMTTEIYVFEFEMKTNELK